MVAYLAIAVVSAYFGSSSRDARTAVPGFTAGVLLLFLVAAI